VIWQPELLRAVRMGGVYREPVTEARARLLAYDGPDGPTLIGVKFRLASEGRSR
jgi:hypothetical protein